MTSCPNKSHRQNTFMFFTCLWIKKVNSIKQMEQKGKKYNNRKKRWEKTLWLLTSLLLYKHLYENSCCTINEVILTKISSEYKLANDS